MLIAVPAKDEEDLIEACLQALLNQKNDCGEQYMTYEVLLLINNTTDRTGQLAQKWADDPRLHIAEVQLPPHRAHIGWARKTAMDWCSARLKENGFPDGIIVSTDADSKLAPDFVASLYQEFAAPHIQAVGGTIRESSLSATYPFTALRTYFDLLDRVYYREQANLPFDLIHTKFTGGVFAVRRQTYQRVGGLSPFPYNEDKDFYDKLRRLDVPIRMSRKVIVYTSMRLAGRTDWGMAAQLRYWNDECRSNKTVQVTCPDQLIQYYRLQTHLYTYQQQPNHAHQFRFLQHCRRLGIEWVGLDDWLSSYDKSAYFGQFWWAFWNHPQVVRDIQRHTKSICIEKALDYLAREVSPSVQQPVLRVA